MHENIRSFGRYLDEFHPFTSELSRAVTLLCCQKCGFLPILVVMFRDMLAFIHTVRTNLGAASLRLSEIVTHRHMWLIFQCVMNIMSLVW